MTIFKLIDEMLKKGGPASQTVEIERLRSEGDEFVLQRSIDRAGSISFTVFRSQVIAGTSTQTSIRAFSGASVAAQMREARPILPGLLAEAGHVSLAQAAQKMEVTTMSLIDSKNFGGVRGMILGVIDSTSKLTNKFELILRFDSDDNDLCFQLSDSVVPDAIAANNSALRAALGDQPLAVEAIAKLDPKFRAMLEAHQITLAISLPKGQVGTKRRQSRL